MKYKITAIVVLIAIFAYLAWILITFLRQKGFENKARWVKQFKMGKWSILFVVSIPLFILGYISNGNSTLDAFFRGFTSTFKLVTLSFDFTFVATNVYTIFKVALFTCYSAVLLNDSLLLISFLIQIIYNSSKHCDFNKSKNDKCLIIGNNKYSQMITQSCLDANLKKVNVHHIIVDKLSKEDKENLFFKKIPYASYDDKEKLIKVIDKYLSKYFKKLINKRNECIQNKQTDVILPRFRIIINTQNEERNILISDILSQYCSRLPDENKDKPTSEVNKFILQYLDIYVFGSNTNVEIYRKYEEISKHCLHFINYNKLIANKFNVEYPLAMYINDKMINHSNILMEPDAQVNVSFIGFGKTNQQIFLSMLSTSPLIKKEGNKVVSFPTEYHFFDKRNAFEDKNLSSYTLRYKYQILDKKVKEKINGKVVYHEFPKFDFLENLDKRLHKTDINSGKFYNDLEQVLKKGKNGKTLNYIVVSLGNDLETIDIANKIISYAKYLGLTNVHIFAGVDNKVIKNNNALYEKANNQNMSFNTFGCENEIYDYYTIIDDLYRNLAIMQNVVYSKIGLPVNINEIRTIKQDDINKWNNIKDLYNKSSSIYAAMSIRHKLLLMGCDIVPMSPEMEAISNSFHKVEDYFAYYGKDNLPSINKRTKAIDYGKEHKPGTLRTHLAILEHDRWNSYMLVNGFIPSSLDEMKNIDKSTKNIDLRRHGCLTTFEGLVDLKNFLVTNKMSEPQWAEYRKYDYQIMDNLFYLLMNVGYWIQKI